MITAKCMGVEVKKSSSCILCNRKLDDSQLQQETIKCQHCRITILSSVAKTKLVCQLLLQIDNKFLTYTAFNDGIQSFLKNIGWTTPAAELDENKLTIKLLSASTQKIMVDKAVRMISHFLPSEGSQTRERRVRQLHQSQQNEKHLKLSGAREWHEIVFVSSNINTISRIWKTILRSYNSRDVKTISYQLG